MDIMTTKFADAKCERLYCTRFKYQRMEVCMRLESSLDIYRDELARVINPYRALELIRARLLEGDVDHIFGLYGLLRDLGVFTPRSSRGTSYVNYVLGVLRMRLLSGSFVLLADHDEHVDTIPVVNGVAQQPPGFHLQEVFFREMARLRERPFHVIPRNRPEFEIEDHQAIRNEMNQRRFEYYSHIWEPRFELVENNDDNFESGSEPEIDQVENNIEYILPPEMVRPLDAAPSYEEAVEYDPPPYSLVDPLENNDADFESGIDLVENDIEYIEQLGTPRPLDVLPSYGEAMGYVPPSYEEVIEYERPPYLLDDPLDNNNFDSNSNSNSNSNSGSESDVRRRHSI